MNTDFPITETYRSANGKNIEFEITLHDGGAGYKLTAQETPKSKGRRIGYGFNSFSPVSPYVALGELRDKIRKELSIRYLDEAGQDWSLTHDSLVGRIVFSDDDGEVVIEADGKKVTGQNLWTILAGYEGFEIELHIKEQ